MKIKGLVLKIILLLACITLLVIAVNTFQIHNTTATYVSKLQEQYLDMTYDTYKNEIIGDILVGDAQITRALFKGISEKKGVGIAIVYKGNNLAYGKTSILMPLKKYKLNLGDRNYAELSLYFTKVPEKQGFFSEFKTLFFIDILVLGLGFVYVLWCFNKTLLSPLAHIVAHLKLKDLENSTTIQAGAIQEIQEVAEALKSHSAEIKEKAIFDAEVSAAKQIAHDIRSPLLTLNRLLDGVIQLPEKERVLLRKATQRITDIANNLLTKHQETLCIDRGAQPELISALLSEILSEKRIQYFGIDLDMHLNILQNAQCLFANIKLVEFKQITSNLIDNAVESIGQKKGRIVVRLVLLNRKNFCIVVEDNGCGISKKVFSKILQGGYTSKKGGHGLGLSEANKIVESWGGKLKIKSRLNEGTKIILTLPQAGVAEWFVDKIRISQNTIIVVLDDDEDIHKIWDEYFGSCVSGENGLKIKHFFDVESFVDFYHQNKYNKLLFLIDYELLNSDKNGLDVIEELSITNAYLVTSRYDDLKIRERARVMTIKIIPKSYVAYIPVVFQDASD